jgi:cytochrome b
MNQTSLLQIGVNMEQNLVYDLPTRVFHWLFAGLFLTAFVIAKAVDDDSALFSYHMLAGLMLSFLVVFRILWGIIGTKHARFSGFTLNPFDLISYFKGILSGDKRRWAGHNPASSWAAVLMLVMALGLGLTGYLMTTSGNKETFEDLHEFLANGFIVIVVLHIAGIILHSIRHKEMIGLSMINGKKSDVSFGQTIPSSRSGVGILLIALVVVFANHLFKNYDSQTRNLQLFGSTLQLGENEKHGERERGWIEFEHDDD